MNPNAAHGFYTAIYNLTFVTDPKLRDDLYAEVLETQRGLRKYYAQEAIENKSEPAPKPRRRRTAEEVAEQVTNSERRA